LKSVLGTIVTLIPAPPRQLREAWRGEFWLAVKQLPKTIKDDIKGRKLAQEVIHKWDRWAPDYEKVKRIDQLERCIKYWEEALTHNPFGDSYAEVITKWTVKYLRELRDREGDMWKP